MGNKNPVTLVSAVVKRNSAVVPGNLCEANIPPTTTNPLPIAIRVIMTCRRVKAQIDIPRIIERPPLLVRLLRQHYFATTRPAIGYADEAVRGVAC
jgi:hypothetical protein